MFPVMNGEPRENSRIATRTESESPYYNALTARRILRIDPNST